MLGGAARDTKPTQGPLWDLPPTLKLALHLPFLLSDFDLSQSPARVKGG